MSYTGATYVDINDDLIFWFDSDDNNTLIVNDDNNKVLEWKSKSLIKYKMITDTLSEPTIGSLSFNGNSSMTLDLYSEYLLSNVSISRYYLNFDTSEIKTTIVNGIIKLNDTINITKFDDICEVDILSSHLNFYYDGQSTFLLCVQKGTQVGEYPTQTEWNAVEGNPYPINNHETFNYFISTSVLDIPGEDIIFDGITKFVIRAYEYDYLGIIPLDDSNYTLNTSFLNSTLDVYFRARLKKTTTFNFSINTDNNAYFGVIKSIGATYEDAKSGLTALNTVHSSVYGTYNYAFGYSHTTLNINEHQLNRTFINFDTSILDLFYKNRIRSVKLLFKTYNYNKESLSLYTKQTNYTELLLNSTEIQDIWNYFSDDDYYNTFDVNTDGLITEIDLNVYTINTTGYTSFAFMSYLYDYSGHTESGITSSFSGIDFNTLKLEVIVEPYLINGINYKQIYSKINETFTLHADKNTDIGLIYWYSDAELTDLIYIGADATFNSDSYKTGDIIYAIIVYDFDTDGINERISTNILEIRLEKIELVFAQLPILSGDITYDVVDIDSIYFKYHSAMKGICYTYTRDIENIYEENLMVSDTSNSEAYNMYNEFDIIDEFYSNKKEVNILYRLNDMNINFNCLELDGQTIYEGTRVLLYSVPPSENDGIYVADYNLRLIKTNELNDSSDSFRCKININSGTYMDYELHTYNYDTSIYNPLIDDITTYPNFDSLLYNETPIVIESYMETIYKNNI